MNYSFLDRLTIVIFTYNRHKFLKRTLNYWSNYNIKLVILDGSDTKLEDPCLKHQNIKYIYNTNGLYERLLSSKDYIDTEFMILGADDEFYLPSALSSCVEFLCKDLSFSSCGGRAIGFDFDYKKRLIGKKIYPRLKNLSLDQDSANKRVFNHFSNYVPAHFYSVIRFEKWKKICLYVFQKKYNFAAAHELQLEFLVMVSGKSKIISELMWMRNNEKEAAHINTEMIKTEIRIFWFDKNFYNEKLDFLSQMNKACNELSTNQNSELNEDSISKLFEVFIKKLFDSRRKNLLRKILYLLPEKIETKLIKFVKKFYKTIITRGDKSLVDEINILKADGTSVNSEDIKQIISILLDSKHNDSSIY